MRIFHLDAGRKFFGVPAIKQILDTMADTGFTHLQLYFSDNQGFRFGLDDMTVTTRFDTYDLAPALGDGYCEGPKSPSGCGRWLNTSDMEQILAYAEEKGIGVIPLLNMPGHMGCMLEKYPHLRYRNSKSSIDMGKEEAVEFALALLSRYVDYFADRGCRYFHFGADEFANDIAPGYPDEIIMGFDRIYHEGGMEHFVRFANAACRIIRDRGMIPMAFNDGVCYANDRTSYGEIDHDLVIDYWSKGWNGYDMASADFLEGEGYRLINAHQKFYCGMGRDMAQRAQAMANYDPHVFEPQTRIGEPAGVMLCFWCDRGNLHGQDDGVTAAESLIPVMKAFGESMRKYD